jgi:hypothetical protein
MAAKVHHDAVGGRGVIGLDQLAREAFSGMLEDLSDCPCKEAVTDLPDQLDIHSKLVKCLPGVGDSSSGHERCGTSLDKPSGFEYYGAAKLRDDVKTNMTGDEYFERLHGFRGL